jgi:hypothetical protein
VSLQDGIFIDENRWRAYGNRTRVFAVGGPVPERLLCSLSPPDVSSRRLPGGRDGGLSAVNRGNVKFFNVKSPPRGRASHVLSRREMA